MRTLYLCGGGNSEGVRLALTINLRQQRWDRIALLDDDPKRRGDRLLGVEIVGGFGLLAEADRERDEVVNLVARTTARRRAAKQKIESYGVPFASLVHPGVDTLGAELADDVIVYEHAVVSPEVRIGEGSVVFMGAVAGHESQVGRYCVLAAGSVLNARVVLEDGVYVGTNAAVLPEVHVGEGATIGACSAVIHDVPKGATAVGVPAEVLLAADTSAAVKASAEELEALIGPVWAGLLNRASVGATESFFDAGGTSLLALQARTRIQEVTGIELAVTDLFRYPTLRALAAHLATGPDDVPARAVARRSAVKVVRRRGASAPGE